MRLKAVLYSAQSHIHSSSQLFKLAQDIFKLASSSAATAAASSDVGGGGGGGSSKHKALMNAAFKLGLQVMLAPAFAHT